MKRCILHLIYISCSSVSTFVHLATLDLNKNCIKANPMPLCKLMEQSVLTREKKNPLQDCSRGPGLLYTAVRHVTSQA